MNKKTLHIILYILITLVINGALFWCGYKFNSDDFWNLTVNGIISLNITIFISFFLVQNFTSKRRKHDFLVKKLDEILSDLEVDYLLVQNDKNASLLQKSVANKIYFIFKACPKSYEKDIVYIKRKFDEIQTYYGDHSDAKKDDPYYERQKINIKDKILKLQLELYGFNMNIEEHSR